MWHSEIKNRNQSIDVNYFSKLQYRLYHRYKNVRNLARRVMESKRQAIKWVWCAKFAAKFDNWSDPLVLYISCYDFCRSRTYATEIKNDVLRIRMGKFIHWRKLRISWLFQTFIKRKWILIPTKLIQEPTLSCGRPHAIRTHLRYLLRIFWAWKSGITSRYAS